MKKINGKKINDQVISIFYSSPRDIKETAELLVKKPLLKFSDNEDEGKSEKEEAQKERSRSPSPR